MDQFLISYFILFEQDWFLYINLTVAGLLGGSFCTMLVHRLPLIINGLSEDNIKPQNNADEYKSLPISLSFPASHCPKCSKPIPIYLNIPLLGYLLSRAKCINCNKPIDIFYPLTELACLLSAILVGGFWGATIEVIPIVLLLWGLITLSIIDIRNGLLPDMLTIGILWIGLIFNPVLPFSSLLHSVWGVVIAYMFLSMFNYGYRIIRQRDGIGGGDIKLFAALGSFFGWNSFLPILLVSSLSGLLFFFIKSFIMTLWFKNKSKHRSNILKASDESMMFKQQIWGPHIALAAVLYVVAFMKMPKLLQIFQVPLLF